MSRAARADHKYRQGFTSGGSRPKQKTFTPIPLAKTEQEADSKTALIDENKDKILNPSNYGAITEGVENWDYVMVFKNPPPATLAPEDSLDNIVHRLHVAGLITKLYYSVGKELIFCKIRAPEDRLRAQADYMDFRLQLDAKELEKAANNGIPEHGIAPFPIKDVKQTYKLSPYDYIFASYSFNAPEDVQKFYMKKGPNGSLFDSTERMMILEHIITTREQGAGCDIEAMIYDEVIIECYPLHEEKMKSQLKRDWIVWNSLPMSQPFEEVNSYFGTKVGLYFLYLGFYTEWLTYPTIAGIIAGVTNYLASTNENAYFSPTFGAFMTIWMTVYLEMWKRVNYRASLRWGTADFHAIEQVRPQYEGECIPSPIDGRPSLYFHPRKKLIRVIYSWLVISFLILIVFGLIFCIFMLRYDLTKGRDANVLVFYGIQAAPAFVGLANVCQIQTMNKIYNYISIILNDQENHRTDVMYENSLIVKTVIFQFVNQFSLLFYVAFLKDGIENCQISCMFELKYTLAIVYGSMLVTGNINEIVIPRFWVYYNQFMLLGWFGEPVDPAIERQRSNAEKELFMAKYDWRGTFDDYTEMIIQFGFTTMFVVAFPFAPLLSYLNNTLEIRLDAYRLLYESRRPRPQFVKDMGYWYEVLQAFSAMAICTNAGVVIFTGNYFEDVGSAERVWLFTLFISGMFFFKYLLESAIDDVPAGVRAQEKRQEFLISKCLYHIPDEDYSNLTKMEADLKRTPSSLTIMDRDT